VIVYSLSCSKGHEFDGWFRDSTAFDEQSKEGKLVCPTCGTRKVAKAMMAPAVAGSKKKTEPTSNDLRQMRQFMTGLRKHIEQNADYVGPDFPEEARKIHYGDIEHRQIYGEATLEEAKELIEEGVDVAPLPPNLDEAVN
jgi:hypothetical protein